MKNVFLIGFMGTGKSTVAAYLREKHGYQLVEMDAMIESRAGMTITQIFERYGEAYFRDLETELVKEIGVSEKQVVSCGGGVVLREENVRIMKQSGMVVMLTASPANILKRVSSDENRPILKGNKNVAFIEGLLEKRRERYEEAADVRVATDEKTIEQIGEEILEKVRG